LLPIERYDHFDDELRELSERVVVVVFADREVDVASTHDILKEEANFFDVLPLRLEGILR